MRHMLPAAALVAASILSACADDSQPDPVGGPVLKAHPHRTLTGHTSVTNGVAFTPDGRLLATALGTYAIFPRRPRA